MPTTCSTFSAKKSNKRTVSVVHLSLCRMVCALKENISELCPTNIG